jgi:hypothetical protein
LLGGKVGKRELGSATIRGRSNSHPRVEATHELWDGLGLGGLEGRRLVEEPGEENALGRAARGCIESATGTASAEWDNLVTTVGAGYVRKLLGIL